MGHNSRRCESGGGGGHPEILSLSRILSKTGRGNQSLKPLCAEKENIKTLP